MTYPTIKGYCPACGGASLFIGDGSYVTCSRADCPEPDAASSILDDAETQHIVQIDETDFTVRHPLIERVAERLMDCDLHARLAAMSGPPVRPGRYRVHRQDADPVEPWFYQRLDTA